MDHGTDRFFQRKSGVARVRSVTRADLDRSGWVFWTVVLVEVFKLFDLLVGFILCDPVGFLDLPRQYIALAVNHFELIVGKLSPLRFDFAFELTPVASYDVPVHLILLFESGGKSLQSFFFRRDRP